MLSTGFGFIAETSWKTCIFTREWLNHLLLMTSYLVTIVADHYQTWLEMRAKDQKTATENVRCWLLIVWEKKLRKTLEKAGTHTTCLYVRGLRSYHRNWNYFFETISSVATDSKDRHWIEVPRPHSLLRLADAFQVTWSKQVFWPSSALSSTEAPAGYPCKNSKNRINRKRAKDARVPRALLFFLPSLPTTRRESKAWDRRRRTGTGHDWNLQTLGPLEKITKKFLWSVLWKYCYEKAIHAVMISFAVVFNLDFSF